MFSCPRTLLYNYDCIQIGLLSGYECNHQLFHVWFKSVTCRGIHLILLPMHEDKIGYTPGLVKAPWIYHYLTIFSMICLSDIVAGLLINFHYGLKQFFFSMCKKFTIILSFQCLFFLLKYSDNALWAAHILSMIPLVILLCLPYQFIFKTRIAQYSYYFYIQHKKAELLKPGVFKRLETRISSNGQMAGELTAKGKQQIQAKNRGVSEDTGVTCWKPLTRDKSLFMSISGIYRQFFMHKNGYHRLYKIYKMMNPQTEMVHPLRY